MSLNFHVEHVVEIVLVHVEGVLLRLSEEIFDLGNVFVHPLVLSWALISLRDLAKSLVLDTLVILGSG